jgi:hypothetical protein
MPDRVCPPICLALYHANNTGIVYIMSIELTRLAFDQENLTPTQQSILNVLCFIANEKHEVYLTIDQICHATSLSKNTVETALKFFREKGTLIYTGEKKGYRARIPVYRIILNHPSDLTLTTPMTGVDKSLITPNDEFNNPNRDALITPAIGIPIDNVLKDNNKDNGKPVCFFSKNPKPQPPKPQPSGECHASPSERELLQEQATEIARQKTIDDFKKMIEKKRFKG